MNHPEKASERIFIRVTPTDKKSFEEAAGENLSDWAKKKLREAANERNGEIKLGFVQGVRTR